MVWIHSALFEKGVIVNDVCSFCAAECEHMEYIFFKCAFGVRCSQKVGLMNEMHATTTDEHVIRWKHGDDVSEKF